MDFQNIDLEKACTELDMYESILRYSPTFHISEYDWELIRSSMNMVYAHNDVDRETIYTNIICARWPNLAGMMNKE